MEVVTTLNTRRGNAGVLAEAIRSRRNRRLPLRLYPIEGTASKYKVYNRSRYIGDTVVRSRCARASLRTGNTPTLTIGWNENRNETLEVHIPA